MIVQVYKRQSWSRAGQPVLKKIVMMTKQVFRLGA